MMSIKKSLFLVVLAATLGGCVTMATQKLADNLSSAMLNQDDPETVRDGAAAWLLLLDGMIRNDTDNASLLLAGARLYGSYAGGLVADEERSRRLASRSLNYARRALCVVETDLCKTPELPFEEFSAAFGRIEERNQAIIYQFATSWAGWIQAHGGDWNALAELPKVEHLLEGVIDRDPAHDKGRAQLYLAVMRTQLPAALGGKPDNGRRHFELAIEYSGGQDLIAMVEFARRYARLVFNQELHDRLLQEVLAADPNITDLTLSNILAQQQARILLADEYF